jgi:hypothetical protein
VSSLSRVRARLAPGAERSVARDFLFDQGREVLVMVPIIYQWYNIPPV